MGFRASVYGKDSAIMNRRRQRNYKRNYEWTEKRPTGGRGSSSLVQRFYTTDCTMGEYGFGSQYPSDLRVT